MIALMLFAATVAVLAGLAALGAERGLRLARLPTRWAWAVSLAASLALPLVRPRLVAAPAALVTEIGGTPAIALPGSFAARAPAADERARELAVAGLLRRAEMALPRAWGAATLLLAAGIASAGWRLARRRRGWAEAEVAGERVLLSDAVGPAVVGVMRPRTVLPRWTLAWAGPQQRMIVRHEREHIAAHDPVLLFAGLCAVVAMPWNPAIWWQLSRLRLAVEVDCDARTLRGERDLAAYGRLLLEVGRHASRALVPVAAFSEPSSFLERRIRAMTDRIPRGRALRLLGWAALATTAAVSAAAIPAPPIVVAPPVAADTLPVLLDASAVARAMQAAYPPLLRDAGVTGTAVLRFRVDSRGVPGEAEVVRASHPAFADAAKRALREARFSAPRGGSAMVTLPFAFQLSGEAAIARRPAAPTPEPGGVLQLADVDRQPELVNRRAVSRALQAGYPPLLRDAGVQGQVVVSMRVGADGTLSAVSILSASHDAFREPALAAVAAMRFRPAERGRRAVPVRLSVPIVFSLSDEELLVR